MFWAVKTVVGQSIYNEQTHRAWVKIFSQMLRVIVPVAVAHELASNEAQQNRVMDHEGAFGYKQSDDSKRMADAVMICPVMNKTNKDSARYVNFIKVYILYIQCIEPTQ